MFVDTWRTLGAISDSWALSELDAELTALCKVIAPLSPQALGFSCAGRRKGMVWMPFADTEESDRLRPQPLTEEALMTANGFTGLRVTVKSLM